MMSKKWIYCLAGAKRSMAVSLICVVLVAGAILSPVWAREKTTIEFWEVWGRAAAFKTVIAPFEKANPDIEVNVVSAPQGLPLIEKLTLRIISGTPPDVVFIAAPATEFLMQGIFLPLDDMVEASDKVSAEDFIPGTYDVFEYQGSHFATPGEGGPTTALIYSRRLFEEAGFVGPPGTLQELLVYHKKLTRRQNEDLKQLGFNPLDAMGGRYYADVWPNVFDFKIYDDDTGTLYIDTVQMRQAVDYIVSFYEDMTVSESWMFGGWTGALASGKVGMQVNGYWVPGELRVMDTADEFGYGWFPNTCRDQMMFFMGWGLAIPKQSKHPTQAFKLLEYMASPEAGQLLFNHVGFLNGSIPAIRELDWSSTPGLEFFIQSTAETERFAVPAKIPVTTFMRSTFSSRVQQVAAGEVAVTEALTNYAHEAEIEMRKLFEK